MAVQADPGTPNMTFCKHNIWQSVTPVHIQKRIFFIRCLRYIFRFLFGNTESTAEIRVFENKVENNTVWEESPNAERLILLKEST